MKLIKKPVYLDYHAHSPLDPEVARILGQAYAIYDANPHSHHGPGENARLALEDARVTISEFVGGRPSELIFTSGATEANNLAFAGVADRLRSSGRRRLLVGAGEHPSVLAAAHALSDFAVDLVPLRADGRIDCDQLSAMLGTDVGLLSVASVNHEVGTIQPIEQIAAMAHDHGALVHSDLAQACGRIPVRTAHLDLASIAAHKFNGPLGIGALFVRRALRRFLIPVLHGGGQEGDVRSGTVPVPLCVAFAAACNQATKLMPEESVRLLTLRQSLLDQLSAAGGLTLNGGLEQRVPGNLNVSFDDVDAEALVMRVRERVSLSTGSACTSTSLEPSHVLAAIGVHGARAEGAIRFGLGRFTTSEEVDYAAAAVLDAVRILRRAVRRAA